MNGGHELVEQVYAAKTDPDAADSLIRQYMGFLRAETAKYLHRAPIEGQDEELSIVLLAFYEAILGYEKKQRRISRLCFKRNPYSAHRLLPQRKKTCKCNFSP